MTSITTADAYEPEVTDAVVELLKATDVAAGRAVAIDYPAVDAA